VAELNIENIFVQAATFQDDISPLKAFAPKNMELMSVTLPVSHEFKL
jgi:hypothetical protein